MAKNIENTEGLLPLTIICFIFDRIFKITDEMYLFRKLKSTTIMEKCVLCDQPLPDINPKHKSSKNLMCTTCNQGILQDAATAKARVDTQETEDEEPESTSEILERIKYLEKSVKELQDMIETAPDACAEAEESVAAFPKAVQAYMHTPIKSFKMMQILLAISKGEYMDSIARKDSEVRLKDALAKSIKNEDFRKSAEILDKIKEKKKKNTKG